jgi:hypothetical protein
MKIHKKFATEITEHTEKVPRTYLHGELLIISSAFLCGLCVLCGLN